jgi:hypothetical protein
VAGWHQTAVPTELMLLPDGTRTVTMPVFGCRKYSGGLPNQSPLGNQQHVVPVSTVFQSSDDYLLPLKALGPTGRLVRQQSGNTNNWYCEFVYLREKDIKAIKGLVDIDALSGWRMRNHPYVRLSNGFMEYASTVYGRVVWYQILVPYRVDLSDSVCNRIRDTRKWMKMIREVTEPTTVDVVRSIDGFF